jgi:hypothetical protein
MIRPITAYLVSGGVYDEYRVLAVFTEHCGAQEFADHHNLTSERYSVDDKAQVEEVDLYGPGWRRPPSEVLDGEVMDPPLRLILDEAANICSVPLDEWPSDVGSPGITLCPAFPVPPAGCVVNPQVLTATDPCRDCGGFDGTHWADSGPGWVACIAVVVMTGQFRLMNPIGVRDGYRSGNRAADRRCGLRVPGRPVVRRDRSREARHGTGLGKPHTLPEA